MIRALIAFLMHERLIAPAPHHWPRVTEWNMAATFATAMAVAVFVSVRVVRRHRRLTSLGDCYRGRAHRSIPFSTLYPDPYLIRSYPMDPGNVLT